MKCAICERPAVFKVRGRGRVKSRGDHDLCPACWRNELNRQRAEKSKQEA